MSDIIRLLPDSVANQIAAGEVIQRPASVVKELVENAVDAGATLIQITVRDAGKTLIQVVDNGKGMSETDARMAFERHATSKISSGADLFSLHTMGFRGEALPSICAVAQVELRTAVPGAQMGTLLKISGSKVERQEPCVCTQGSNFMVKNLFFNVPARRKFLKSDSSELGKVLREFERLALVNNHLHLRLDTGGRVIDLRPAQFKQRIADLWKNNLKMQLLPVDVATSLVKISGFISRPENARRHNPLQFLIVNGRNMRHPVFQRAIMSCFERLIPVDSKPCYFLKFEVDPASIDVNIHPAKEEIKFENEQEIRAILVAAVREALGKFAAVPSIDFDSDPLPISPPHSGDFVNAPPSVGSQGYNPFKQKVSQPKRDSFAPGACGSADLRDWEKLYSDFTMQSCASAPQAEPEQPELPGLDGEGIAPMSLQFARKYIVATSRKGLMLIDQHRAHVKILYHKYLDQLSRGIPASQQVMFAEEFTVDPAQRPLFDELLPGLRKLGFAIDETSPEHWQVNAVPAIASGCSPKETLLAILDSADYNSEVWRGGTPDGSLLDSRVALALARSAAIKRGTPLSAPEMEKLLGELFSLPDPQYTPAGKAVYTVMTETQINMLLG